jgi:hypothetical protein
MNNELLTILIPVVLAITEGYKLFIIKCPASDKVRLWMTAFIPLFALTISFVISVVLFGFNTDGFLNGIIAGLSAVGLYDGVKYSRRTVGKLLNNQ